MIKFRYVAKNEQETEHLGKRLAETLPAGAVVALVGTLGAGKTRLVQAVVTALGVPREEISSPTFVLVNEYLGGRAPVYHFDAYRLRDEDEFLGLGPEEYFEASGITFVEWADRVSTCLPEDYLTICIQVLSETSRGFTLTASSPIYEPLIKNLNDQEIE